MKKLYTALFALGLAFGANAQNSYQLDSTFNGVGYKMFNADLPNVNFNGCVLNNDGSMVVSCKSGVGITNTRTAAKINANGSINTSLCGNVCVDTVGSSYYTGVYKLGSNYYFASTGYGGDALIGNATSLDNQVYDKYETKATVSLQYDNNHIIEATSGQATIYAFKINAAASGYAGASGIINGATNSHGGIVPAINGVPNNGIKVNSLGIQSNKSILAAGSIYVGQELPFIVRYKPNSLIMDSTFGTNGVVTLSTTTADVTTMEIDANDNIFAFYGNGTDAKMAILNPNGSINTTANLGGIIPMPWTIYNATVTKQGTILITVDGGPNKAKVIAYTYKGNPDLTFYNNSSEMIMANVLPTFTYLNFKSIASDDYGNLVLHGYNDNTNPLGYIGTMVKLKSLNPVTPASISNTFKATAIEIYPNPATSSISFNLENVSKNATVSIFSIDGKIIEQQNIISERTEMNIENLNAGIYLLKIKNGDQNLMSKFYKK